MKKPFVAMEETQYLDNGEKKASVGWTDKPPIVTVTQPIQMTGRSDHRTCTRYIIISVSLALLSMTASMTVLTYAHVKNCETKRNMQLALIEESLNAPARMDLQYEGIPGGMEQSNRRITKRQSCEDPCVSDCTNVTDGDYQSCNGCGVYVTCSSGSTFDDRPCPSGLEWDDSLKRCDSTSTTCFPDVCITTCTGQSNGDYQSCNGCRVYATCSNEIMYNDRPCPANLVWDDTAKRCEYTSPTCIECN